MDEQWMQFDASTSSWNLCSKLNHTYGNSDWKNNGRLYHVPTHIQEHIDYITSDIKLFSGKRPPNPNSDLKKRGYLLPPLLKFLA
ncbi:hypothetical protein BGZ57DRAFT_946940 [Hyaloscypha finlandica]|nr:hypothetical protein BGZ57DRAFT_946940 [Hyaloscypha finlandica]